MDGNAVARNGHGAITHSQRAEIKCVGTAGPATRVVLEDVVVLIWQVRILV